MSPPLALQASSDSGDHAVGIANIRVLITQDGPFWLAQGVEIDCFAQGDTPEEAMENFGLGFASTVELYLEHHESIGPMLKWAPVDVYRPLMEGIEYRFTHVSLHEIAPDQKLEVADLPFAGISFGIPSDVSGPQLRA